MGEGRKMNERESVKCRGLFHASAGLLLKINEATHPSTACK